MFQTLTNMIVGPRDWNESIWWKMIFAISVPRNSAFTQETQVLHLFTRGRLTNIPKHLQKSFWVQSSMMDAFGVKPFS
jgi:hypothetical protein